MLTFDLTSTKVLHHARYSIHYPQYSCMGFFTANAPVSIMAS